MVNVKLINNERSKSKTKMIKEERKTYERAKQQNKKMGKECERHVGKQAWKAEW
jgi:hypothetical protein